MSLLKISNAWFTAGGKKYAEICLEAKFNFQKMVNVFIQLWMYLGIYYYKNTLQI